MSELLALLTPSCVGALIGYVTNKVAIRMLFRADQIGRASCRERV